MVHGAEQTGRAERASELLFGERITDLTADDVLGVLEDVPSTDVAAHEVEPDGIGIVDLLVRAQAAPSKSEARRLVQGGGVYVNNRRAADPQARLRRDEAIGGRVFVLRKGQKQQYVIRLT
jgi:tyrosyl-tRNA synthetase